MTRGTERFTPDRNALNMEISDKENILQKEKIVING